MSGNLLAGIELASSSISSPRLPGTASARTPTSWWRVSLTRSRYPSSSSWPLQTDPTSYARAAPHDPHPARCGRSSARPESIARGQSAPMQANPLCLSPLVRYRSRTRPLPDAVTIPVPWASVIQAESPLATPDARATWLSCGMHQGPRPDYALRPARVSTSDFVRHRARAGARCAAPKAAVRHAPIFW